jgi:hypothetical protein
VTVLRSRCTRQRTGCDIRWSQVSLDSHLWIFNHLLKQETPFAPKGDCGIGGSPLLSPACGFCNTSRTRTRNLNSLNSRDLFVSWSGKTVSTWDRKHIQSRFKPIQSHLIAGVSHLLTLLSSHWHVMNPASDSHLSIDSLNDSRPWKRAASWSRRNSSCPNGSASSFHSVRPFLFQV